jgi:hypothetical protein
MVSLPQSAHHSQPRPHDIVTRAAHWGAVLGGTFGAVLGFIVDIDQVLSSGPGNRLGLFAMPPTLLFVGIMLGRAIGASVGIALHALEGCCGCASEHAAEHQQSATPEVREALGEPEHAMA